MRYFWSILYKSISWKSAYCFSIDAKLRKIFFIRQLLFSFNAVLRGAILYATKKKWLLLRDNMDSDVLPTVPGISCCWSNSTSCPSRSGPEIIDGGEIRVSGRITIRASTLDRTYEFQAGRRAVEAVSAFASVEFAITRIVPDPRRHTVVFIQSVEAGRSETSTTAPPTLCYVRTYRDGETPRDISGREFQIAGEPRSRENRISSERPRKRHDISLREREVIRRQKKLYGLRARDPRAVFEKKNIYIQVHIYTRVYVFSIIN